MTIDPSTQDHRNIYKLMTGLIVPRPIAFVSTIDPTGRRNLAPFSFFTAASANPPVICFSPLIRGSDGMKKDTLRNIESTGEFVVNVVSEEFAEKMNLCSTEFPPEVDEFEAAGLHAEPSDLVKPPRVRESHAAMECRLLQIVEVSSLPLGGSIVLGEVLRFQIDDQLLDNFRIDQSLLKAFGRLGGFTYARTTDRFDLIRPKTGEIKDK